MRLDKFLADCGLGSRSEVKVLLKQKRVTVEDLVIADGKFQVNKDSRAVKFDGEPLVRVEWIYYMLNKPAGVVSATKDVFDRTVVDLLAGKDFREDIFPVGRLDKNTEGLLILTNDGALGHELTSPVKHVEKEYFAQVDGRVTQETIAAFSAGLTLKNGETARPAELFIDKIDENSMTRLGVASDIRVVVHEGKFHQVKRMFEAVGMYVLSLKRLRMGNLRLDESLQPGAYRALTATEVELLKSCKNLEQLS